MLKEKWYNVLFAEFYLGRAKKDVKVRHEIFEFKDSEGQKMRQQMTPKVLYPVMMKDLVLKETQTDFWKNRWYFP